MQIRRNRKLIKLNLITFMSYSYTAYDVVSLIFWNLTICCIIKLHNTDAQTNTD